MLSKLVGDSTFTITNPKLCVPIVTLSTEDNAKLSKLFSGGFKRPVYWNKHKVITNKTYDENDYIRKLLDNCYQGVKKLFRDCDLIEMVVVVIELQLILTEDIPSTSKN